MKMWTFDEVRPKLDGPWSTEPDKAQWIDEKTGLDCLAVRNQLGAWCGYVGVPAGHPLYGKGYDAVYDVACLDVHGGLTFADKCQEGRENGPGVCHVPEAGRPADVWWLGFDCAHSGDLVPGMQETYDKLGMDRSWRRGEVYRTFAYVQAEVTNLAAQLSSADQPELI